ncbi:hypothetical protein K470DRAFT_152431 [Piedraia hortae CBS 480.64]|uniref:Uncharacterized protein n=1 Tax=Piedraia hortae CBS 480.64 TaxID=1314780 RepID=A0A6A7BRF9_9PEZI|nr:hypothetical protein K470DRAFT_152431 [Piedraia hortae CBS 480.64]
MLLRVLDRHCSLQTSLERHKKEEHVLGQGDASEPWAEGLDIWTAEMHWQGRPDHRTHPGSWNVQSCLVEDTSSITGSVNRRMGSPVCSRYGQIGRRVEMTRFSIASLVDALIPDHASVQKEKERGCTKSVEGKTWDSCFTGDLSSEDDAGRGPWMRMLAEAEIEEGRREECYCNQRSNDITNSQHMHP